MLKPSKQGTTLQVLHNWSLAGALARAMPIPEAAILMATIVLSAKQKRVSLNCTSLSWFST